MLLDKVRILLYGIAQGVEKRGLKARERVIELALDVWLSKLKGLAVALLCQTVDNRAARVGKPKKQK